MAVYSNTQIKQAIEQGSIVCVPFRPEYLHPTGLDVTLGYYYFSVSRHTVRSVHDPCNKKDLVRYFDGPHKAVTHQEWCKRNGLKPVNNIPLDYPVIGIAPRERLLAHTHEFLGVMSPSTAEVRSLANWSRNGIIASLSSGRIEPNQVNRYILELYNSNERKTILLPVGERIAQVIFWHQAGADTADNDLATHEWDVNPDAALSAWTPELLLQG